MKLLINLLSKIFLVAGLTNAQTTNVPHLSKKLELLIITILNYIFGAVLEPTFILTLECYL